ncbi:MAG: Uma2 family endonuclease [Alphaproteobacteria bacterium]|nr:Uma2 family endonuclease [Alphaproteobacteria bacterium]
MEALLAGADGGAVVSDHRYAPPMRSAIELHHGAFMNEAAFMKLPETNQRMELVDGVVIVPPSSTVRHQRVVLNLGMALHRWREQHPALEVMPLPIDVRIGLARIVQPDVVVWIDGLEDEALPIRQRPDLVIEVVSPTNIAYDRVTKRILYADAGIPEAWFVHPARRLVERFTGPRLVRSELLTDVIESPLLPGFSMTAAELFDD